MSLERDKKKLKRQRLFDIQLKGQKVIGRKAQALSQQVSMTKTFKYKSQMYWHINAVNWVN